MGKPEFTIVFGSPAFTHVFYFQVPGEDRWDSALALAHGEWKRKRKSELFEVEWIKIRRGHLSASEMRAEETVNVTTED